MIHAGNPRGGSPRRHRGAGLERFAFAPRGPGAGRRRGQRPARRRDRRRGTGKAGSGRGRAAAPRRHGGRRADLDDLLDKGAATKAAVRARPRRRSTRRWAEKRTKRHKSRRGRPRRSTRRSRESPGKTKRPPPVSPRRSTLSHRARRTVDSRLAVAPASTRLAISSSVEGGRARPRADLARSRRVVRCSSRRGSMLSRKAIVRRCAPSSRGRRTRTSSSRETSTTTRGACLRAEELSGPLDLAHPQGSSRRVRRAR